MQKFIHITDTHFVPPGNLLYGLNPIDRLALCVADVNRHHPDAAFAIFTGDLAHKGQPEAYQALKREVDKLVIPFHLMVGNHDDRANFRATFPATPVDAGGFIQYAFEWAKACSACASIPTSRASRGAASAKSAEHGSDRRSTRPATGR